MQNDSKNSLSPAPQAGEGGAKRREKVIIDIINFGMLNN
jgi:hypothetical protein